MKTTTHRAKYVSLFLLFAFSLCDFAWAQKSSLTITTTGLDEGVKIVVNMPQGSRLVPYDTLMPNDKGNVKVEVEAEEPVFLALTLTLPQTPMVHVIMLPKEKATMKMGYDKSNNYLRINEVKGSPNMELYRQYNNLIDDARTDQRLQGGIPTIMESLIRKNSSVLMSAFLVTYFESAFEQYAPLYKEVRDALIGRYPNNEFVQHVNQKVSTAVIAGMEAPDIVLADRDGKDRKLSDLRGKVVLIDFWASWCRPCRMENPNVVQAYQKYHDKGFEIFSVSLDNNRDAWLKAIDDDHLVWPNHVSDLRGWSSAGGKLYGISSIPATVLVGRDGTILARNLRGAELEQKLKEIFGE